MEVLGPSSEQNSRALTGGTTMGLSISETLEAGSQNSRILESKAPPGF